MVCLYEDEIEKVAHLLQSHFPTIHSLVLIQGPRNRIETTLGQIRRGTDHKIRAPSLVLQAGNVAEPGRQNEAPSAPHKQLAFPSFTFSSPSCRRNSLGPYPIPKRGHASTYQPRVTLPSSQRNNVRDMTVVQQSFYSNLFA